MMGIVEGAFLFVLMIIVLTVPVAVVLVFGAKLIPARVRSGWRERTEGMGPLVIVAVMLLAGYLLVDAGCEQSTPSLHENDMPLFGPAEPGG